MPRLSSSASTSSGTLPLIRTGYIPRTLSAVWRSEYSPAGPVGLQGVAHMSAATVQPNSFQGLSTRQSRQNMPRCTEYGPENLSSAFVSGSRPMHPELVGTGLKDLFARQPFLRKFPGVWIIEHRRHALICLAFGCGGMAT